MNDEMIRLFKEYPECRSQLVSLIDMNDLDYADSFRMCFIDDAYQKVEYNKASTCCGTFEARMMVDGREVLIGCNYGH
jgi:hypothetical protein